MIFSKINSSAEQQNRLNHSAFKDRVLVWDGWRGLAIILVLVGHFSAINGIWEARLGVHIFFVLSGMLMSTILFEKRMSLKDFYIRRFSRIYPVFFVFIVFAFVSSFLASHFLGKADYSFSSSEVISSFVFLRTYVPLDPHIWVTKVPIGHLWSLNVEEHAYIIMSVLTLFFIRKNNVKIGFLLLLIGLVSIAINFYYFSIHSEQTDPRRFYTIRTETAICFIVLSAGYNLLKNSYAIKVQPIFPLISFVLAICCYLSFVPEWATFSLAPILLAFTINHLTEAHALLRGLLEIKFIRMLGLWSYSLYIWQQPFYIYKDIVPGGKYVALLLALFVGILSYYLFENPVRNWINNRWTK